jgi:hypothetical protein
MRESCGHNKTHPELWPDGGEIEVCDNCGMSRYIWEQGETDWQTVEDIPEARRQVKEGLETIEKVGRIMKEFKRPVWG